MTSIGETLRRERLRRNLELGKIAGELKISARFLEAIEAEDFGKLPGGVFTKSFVRQYASFLGLDAEEMAKEVQRLVEPQPETPAQQEKSKPHVPLIRLQFGEDWQSVGEHSAPWPSWITAGGLLLALMLVCSGVYWWWERPHHQPVVVQAPPPKVTPAPQTAPPAVQPPDSPPVAADSPAAVPPAVQPSTTQSAAVPPAPAVASGLANRASNPNASVRVAVTADEAVWIRADVNGKYQFSGVLPAHETRNIDADGEVRLRLGNAGGATVNFNGKSIGAVGPKGQVRTVQFTSGGFQILSSKPADPLERL